MMAARAPAKIGNWKISRSKWWWLIPVSVILLIVAICWQETEALQSRRKYYDPKAAIPDGTSNRIELTRWGIQYRIVARVDCAKDHRIEDTDDGAKQYMSEDNNTIPEKNIDFCPYFKFVPLKTNVCCVHRMPKNKKPSFFQPPVYTAEGVYSFVWKETLQPPFAMQVYKREAFKYVLAGNEVCSDSLLPYCSQTNFVGFFTHITNYKCWLWHMRMKNESINTATAIICRNKMKLTAKDVDNMITTVKNRYPELLNGLCSTNCTSDVRIQRNYNF